MPPKRRQIPAVICAWSPFCRRRDRLVGVLVILYAWQLPPFTRHSQFTDNAYVRGQTTFISPQVNGYITDVPVQDFANVKKAI